MAIAVTTITVGSRRTLHRGHDLTGMHAGRAKAAELASGLGAIVLGAGLALVLPMWLRSYAMPVLIAGTLVHGVGMTLKYRLEQRDGPPRRWERALFWLCWLCLAALGVWLAMGFLAAG